MQIGLGPLENSLIPEGLGTPEIVPQIVHVCAYMHFPWERSVDFPSFLQKYPIPRGSEPLLWIGASIRLGCSIPSSLPGVPELLASSSLPSLGRQPHRGGFSVASSHFLALTEAP